MEDDFIRYKLFRKFNSTSIFVSECGGVMTVNTRKGRNYLKPRLHACPAMIALKCAAYPDINVYIMNNTTNFFVHRLVAEVWLYPKNLFEIEVDHLDGNIMNYHVLNLEWVTKEENTRRRWEKYYQTHKRKKGAKQ